MLTIYRASAGSGKTYTLTQRYIELLFDSHIPQAHRRILAVTFTHKATNEMKTRILQSLNELATGEDSAYRNILIERYHITPKQVNEKAKIILTQILQDYSAVSISTIDSFFQQIIRSFAHEIGLSGSYAIELDNDEILTQAVDNLFFELDKHKDLGKWLKRFAEENIAEGKKWDPHDEMVTLGKELFRESCQNQMDKLNEVLQDKNFLKKYKAILHQEIKQYEEKTKSLAKQALQMIADAGLTPTDFKGGSKSQMRIRLNDILDDIFELPTPTFLKMSQNVDDCYTKGSSCSETIKQLYNNGLQNILLEIIAQFGEPYTRYCTAKTIKKHLNTLGILSDISLEIKRQNKEQNRLPISDTNLLLQGIIDGSDTPFVYEKIGANIRHFMIDEFQDTSAMQWHNFRPLVTDSVATGNANLVVGDVKQSIYRWRNSDWRLLDEQVQNDISTCQEEALTSNWRSRKTLVEFNNRFFEQAAQIIQQTLNDEIDKANEQAAELLPLRTKITHAYAQLKQQPQKQTEGFVQVQFVPPSDSDSKAEIETLNQLPALLDNLQQRGIPFGRVAFLVRTTANAQMLTQFLVEKKYKVVSNEGLLISSAGAVRFLVGMLRLFAQPDNELERVAVFYEYAVGKMQKTRSEALELAINAIQTQSLFSRHEQKKLQYLRNLSLFDKTEKLVATFGVNKWNDESVYVQAFLDVVYNFSVSKTTDLNTFLTWWDKQSSKKAIPTPETHDALQIMTIHKSKGLEFDVVIVPFCNWDMPLTSQKQNILWCKPTEQPFNQLPLVPIVATRNLTNTLFANDYYQEQMHSYIDNLNLMYVAFTRPRNELYVFAPQPKKDTTNTAGSLLHLCFSNSNWNLTDNTLTLGVQSTQANHSSLPAVPTTHLQYHSIDLGNRLSLRQLSADYWTSEENKTESRLNVGVLMHELLRNINQKSDQEPALQIMLAAGRINEMEAEQMRQELQNLWAMPQINDWFSGKYKVLNEATILTPQGNTYRPDRLMISVDGEAIIVDYKFGTLQQKSYEQQVRNYMQLVKQMGYSTRGYLCYVKLSEIKEIK